jgi:diguanylate cyclase (GGDEF)-like protein
VLRPTETLRGRLVLACLAVQVVLGVALIGLGSHQLVERFSDQAQSQARQLVATLDHAVATPLAQRDYASLQQLLELVRESSDLAYLVLSDHRGVRIASTGWAAGRALPERDKGRVDLHRADELWHVGADIGLSGQKLGRLDIGLQTAGLREAHHHFLLRSLALGLLALLASGAVLTWISWRMTHRLAGLAAASRQVAEGRYDTVLPEWPADELGRLGASFNTMAGTVQQRVLALQTSEVAQRQQLDTIEDERRRLQALLDALRHGVVLLDDQQRAVFANPAFQQLWRLAEPVRGQSGAQLLAMLAEQLGDSHDTLLQQRLLPVRPAGAAQELQLRDGRLIVHHSHPVPTGGCIWVHEDVTAARLTEQRAEQALIDPLTRLANRRGLFESLRSSLAQHEGTPTAVALLFLDLDDFKRANDLGGHRGGDRLLVAVAARIAAELEAGQLVARLGGDEFAVLAPGLDVSGACELAARLVRAIGQVEVANGPVRLRTGCSAGVALSPLHALAADDLVACADTAMYQAKHEGKGQWALYSAEAASVRARSARMDWNERIRRALESERFVLHFQPVVATQDRSLCHHEALIRMVDEHDPERLISPQNFIAQAERSGRIAQIDRWVFSSCIAHLAREPALPALAANLSLRSLEDPSFAGFLLDELRRHAVDPRRLHVELTESNDIDDETLAIARIAQLRSMGCEVHLDDFGAGFNTFTRLRRLPVDAVKIDGSFIRDIEHDPVHRLLVGALVQVARSLHKRTIAEHVQTPAAWAILAQLGVDQVQGSFIGEPQAFEDLGATSIATSNATSSATIEPWTPAPPSPARPVSASSASAMP